MPEESQTIRERIVILLRKYHEKCLAEDEEQELEAYCRQIPELRSVLQRLDDEELVNKDLADLDKSDPELRLPMVRERLDATIEHRSSGGRIIRQWAIPAAAILLLMFSIHLITNPTTEKKEESVKSGQRTLYPSKQVTLTLFDGQPLFLDDATNGKKWTKGGITVLKTGDGQATYKTDIGVEDAQGFNTLSIPRGAQFVLTLPDSTRVWLNNASILYFPATFHGSSRNVTLIGEAYFEVAKNDRQPFFVTVGSEENRDTIQVLGTSFNVSAYPNEPNIETTLLTGKVRITGKGNTVQLNPDEQLISGQNGTWSPQKATDTGNIVAWKKGRFNFVGNDIFQAMRQLERWYDISTEVRGPITQRKFMTTLEHQPLGDLLQELSVRGSFQYKFEGRKLIVSL